MIASLSVQRLADLWSPYRVRMWGSHTLTLDHVRWCDSAGLTLLPDAEPCPDDGDGGFLSHAARVAWLASRPQRDPLLIVACRDVHPVRDGNHRLAAAIYAEVETISVDYHGPADLLAVLTGEAPCPWERRGDAFDHLMAAAWWTGCKASLPTLGEVDLQQREGT